MNILIVNYEYPPLGGGGGVATKDIAEMLAKKHTVHVITSHFKNRKAEEMTVNGVHVHRVYVRGRQDMPTATFLSMLTFIPSAFIVGIRLCKKMLFDVLNAQFVLPSGIPAVGLAMMFRIPFVLSFIGGDVYDPTKGISPHRHFFFRQMIRFISKKARICTAISEDTKQRAQELHHVTNQIVVTPIGYAPFEASPVPKEHLNVRSDMPLAISIGRLIPRKGYMTLLEAWKDIPDAQLVIIGDGPLRVELEHVIQEFQLENRVKLVGYLPSEKKYEYLRAADFYISAAKHEGFGIVFLEAMHAGLPIIVTNNGGHTDFLKERINALLVPTDDSTSLTQAIRTLLSNTQLRKEMGERNRQEVKAYTIDRTTEKFEEVLEQASHTPTI